MKLSFVGAALLISVLSTDAQNLIPNLPPPPPPPGYSGSQSYSVPPNYNSRPPGPRNRGDRIGVYFGNPNPQYPPLPSWFPRDFGPPDIDHMVKLLASIIDDKFFEMFEEKMNMWKENGSRRKHKCRHHHGHSQYSTGLHQGYAGPPQGYFGPPQGYFGPPQGYPRPFQGYSVPGTQPSGSAVPPPSGTQQSNYGSPPNPGMYNYHGSVSQQQPFPGSVPSAFPSPQYSAGPAPFVPPPADPATVSSGVQVPGNSTLPASGMPGNSTEKSPA